MRSRLVACALIAMGAGGFSVRASVSYIPLTIDTERQGIRWRTQLLVSNAGEERRHFTPFFIPTNTDGTTRGDGLLPAIVVEPQRSVFFSDLVEGAGELGMMELDAAPQLVFSSRLSATDPLGGEHLGANLPIISDANMIQAGEPGYIQGWTRTADRQTDFGVVNLEDRAIECLLEIYDSMGNLLFGPWHDMPVPARGHRHFKDALGIIGESGVDMVRAAISCDGAYYPYGVIFDLSDLDARFLTPGTYDSALSAPGDGAAPEPDADPTPQPEPSGEAFTFRQNGVFHVPTRSRPVRTFNLPFDRGIVYRVIRLEMDVLHGGWFRANPEGIHNFFLLVRNEYRSNTFGYVNARGPGRGLISSTTNVDLPAGVVSRRIDRYLLREGHRYHLEYTYDTRAGEVTVVLRDLTDGSRGAITDSTTVESIVTEGRGFELRIGRPLINVDVPTYGWEYSNLVLEFLP